MVRYEEIREDARVLPFYGRRRLLRYADCFRDLSDIYLKCVSEQVNDKRDRRQALEYLRIYDNEVRMSKRLLQIADRIRVIADENITYSLPPKNKIRALRILLREHGIRLKEIFFIKKEIGTEIALTMMGSKEADYTTDEIAEALGKIFSMPIVSARDNYYFVSYEFDTYLFETRPPFVLESGYAIVPKETEKISGDSYLFFDRSESDRYVILSDGAGSGEYAHKDSEFVLDYFVRYLETGFSMYEASSMVNSIFLSGYREVNMPTLDACHVDLRTGTAHFIKYGAVNTYIRRRNTVEVIENGGFPLGFRENEEEKIISPQYDLSGGEVCIMISDGILECFKDESDFRELLLKTSVFDPVVLSATLMQYVIGLTQGKIRDDMTILAFRIKERNGNNQTKD